MIRSVIAWGVLLSLAAADAAEPIAAEPRNAPTEGYKETIPGTGVSFEMVPVPGGVVRLPVGAEGDDSAVVEVELPPFWVGKHEVTWAEYRQYMALDKVYAELQQVADAAGTEGVLQDAPALAKALAVGRTADASALGVDAVTAPTPLYDPSTTYESGEDPSLPAVTMTPFAAQQYTKWLSGLTGHDYRLPSEAEWLLVFGTNGEPAADAELDARAWYTDNSEFVAHPVGEKVAGARGVHDLLGNAAELVLDAFRPAGRPELAGKRVGWAEGVAWPTDADARFAKGGWYDAESEDLSPAARFVTDDEEWKSSDPNLPRSPWWFADYPATGVGFRLVRPMAPIPAELKQRVWDTSDAEVARGVTERLREGRGKLGPVTRDWPAVVEELGRPEVRELVK